MENKMFEIKAAIAAVFSTLGAFLGWQGVLAMIWLCSMVLDYLSGSMAAAKNHEWSSTVAREGIFHKAGMILVVFVSGMADIGMHQAIANLEIGITWHYYLFPLVLIWYILTELGSILENAVKLGAAVPSWLTKLLKVSLETVNDTADKSEEV